MADLEDDGAQAPQVRPDIGLDPHHVVDRAFAMERGSDVDDVFPVLFAEEDDRRILPGRGDVLGVHVLADHPLLVRGDHFAGSDLVDIDLDELREGRVQGAEGGAKDAVRAVSGLLQVATADLGLEGPHQDESLGAYAVLDDRFRPDVDECRADRHCKCQREDEGQDDLGDELHCLTPGRLKAIYNL